MEGSADSCPHLAWSSQPLAPSFLVAPSLWDKSCPERLLESREGLRFLRHQRRSQPCSRSSYTGCRTLLLGLSQAWRYRDDQDTVPQGAYRPSKEADRLRSDCQGRVEGEVSLVLNPFSCGVSMYQYYPHTGAEPLRLAELWNRQWSFHTLGQPLFCRTLETPLGLSFQTCKMPST